MIKPVKHLHGLSPIEDWIQHSQYVEQQRDELRKRIEGLIGEYDEKLDQATAQRTFAELHNVVLQTYYLRGRIDAITAILDCLRAILASPDTVSAEKGADGSL